MKWFHWSAGTRDVTLAPQIHEGIRGIDRRGSSQIGLKQAAQSRFPISRKIHTKATMAMTETTMMTIRPPLSNPPTTPPPA